jgi:4-hydroxybenzoate polyprenyltransferase
MTAAAQTPALSPPAPPRTVATKITALARDIKLSHTVFAMPFALLATFLAASGWPGLGRLLLILGCMVTARTVAMSANRLIDAELDKQNPRTAGRALPSGRLSRAFVLSTLLICAALFVLFAAGFWFFYDNRWPVLLAPLVLLYFIGYPLTKRFTRFCHYYLGAALALAPVCAWLAIAGNVGRAAWLIAGAVLFWTAGFDILYACQDYAVDVASRLFSVPSRIGIPAALWVARGTHAISAGFLIALALSTPILRPLFPFGVATAIGLLIVEHCLVRPNDLKRLNVAFFTINGIISLLLASLGIADVLMH